MNNYSDELFIFLLLGVPALILTGFIMFTHVDINPGTGQQIGYIAEVQTSGLFWKLDAISLIGSEATFSESQTSWDYGSTGPNVTEIARYYMKTHEKVIVNYTSDVFVWSWDYPNAARIINITPASGGV